MNDVAGVARQEVQLMRAAGCVVDFFPTPQLAAGRGPFLKWLAMPLRVLQLTPLVSRLRSGHYDVLHVHFVSHGLVGLVCDTPYVIHAHGSDLHLNFRYPLLRLAGRAALRRAGRIVYVTPNLREFLHGFEDRACLLGNPIDSSRFSRGPAPAAINRALIFARLDPVKGVERIFEQATELAADVSLTALDWGPLAGVYKRRFGDRVNFVKPVPPDGLATFLAGFDVVLGQMRQGILSLSELEVLAAGRPLMMRLDQELYQDDPPPVHHVAEGEQLAKAICALRSDPARVRWLCEEGPRWVARHHAPAMHAAALGRIYREAIRARRSGAGRARARPQGTPRG